MNRIKQLRIRQLELEEQVAELKEQIGIEKSFRKVDAVEIAELTQERDRYRKAMREAQVNSEWPDKVYSVLQKALEDSDG